MTDASFVLRMHAFNDDDDVDDQHDDHDEVM